MTARDGRTVFVKDSIPGTAPAGMIPDRQGRMAPKRRALKARRLKQVFLGVGFLLLLGAGWLYPLLGYFIPFCMLLGIGLAAFLGRTWCDWLCPRGSFVDAWLGKISRRGQIPQVFRSTPLRLGVMAFLMSVLTYQIIRLWPDPWAIGGFFVLLLSITTVVGVALGVIFQQRTWCYLCPIGTMSNWVGRNRRPLTLDPEKCTNCTVCARQCPMQLSPMALKEETAMANRGDCLKCSLCVESCPQRALSFPQDKSDGLAA